MTAILDPIVLKPGGLLTVTVGGENDVTQELPTHTCCHCQRIVVHNPARKRPRNMCRKCSAYTCDSKVCVSDCNPFMREVERGVRNLDWQPWNLRASDGSPVDRIWINETEWILIKRSDNGMSQRELSRNAHPSPIEIERLTRKAIFKSSRPVVSK